MRALIVGGGPVDSSQLKNELAAEPELLIAADAGGKRLADLGRFPHILVGDFDSISGDILEAARKAGTVIYPYPAAKDQTDMELAVDLALERGANRLRILGGLGGRLDHTLANLGLLAKAAQKGVTAVLLDSRHEVSLSDGHLELRSVPGRAVSLIPLTPEVKGVRTDGMKFPLLDEDLYFHHTRGIHNEFTGEAARITFKQGLLLAVIFREDNPVD